MEIEVTKSGQAVIVRLDGRLDGAHAPTFETLVLECIRAGDKRVIIDLTKLAYVTSVGLRAFLVCAKKADEAGGALALFGWNDTVKEICETGGFNEILPFLATEPEALARVSA